MAIKPNDYDFCGWATKNDLKCSDGRVIRSGAFKHNDGDRVPLVWNHERNDPFHVLGYAVLENCPEGVRAYGKFNETDQGENAKMLVQHGDVDKLSIYANKIVQQGCDVISGRIKEVSLVIAGANPGAFIEDVVTHSENELGEMILLTGEYLSSPSEVEHSSEKSEEEPKEELDEKTIKDIFDTMTDDEKKAAYAIVSIALDEEDPESSTSHSDVSDGIEHSDSKTIKDIFDEMSDEKKNAVYAMVALAINAKEQIKHNDTSDEEDDTTMKTNVFDEEGRTIEHREQEANFMNDVIGDAKRYGSMKESFIAHTEGDAANEYGITNIDYLFPEAKELNNVPEFIARENYWVKVVMGGTHHTPFSRIKTRFADITEDEARAKGYIKGKLKKEEVFSLLKRSTSPTTIYKKQKLDRDDITDITDFDVVAWIKTEMRGQLDEEIARAILFGDQRLASSDDKINESCIRPIVSDADLFVIRWGVANGSSTSEKAKNFITACIKSRKNYKGSGNPILFTTEDMLTEMLLLEDTIGHRLYKTEQELATTLRVSRIVTVPVMEGLEVDVNGTGKDVHGIIVNLSDYSVGADKGGSINMFEDFDIDYNQQKYLMETRCSGALTKPFSAIVIREADTTASLEPTIAQATAPFKS